MTTKTNVERLTEAGVIPKGYKNLTAAEKATVWAPSFIRGPI